ncbi:MAG: IS1380 family transposase, partial [Deltaproteobacteria bacterium]|nr:IS1380 family transposase [Deltaproteobacteria bacterium]
MTVRQGVLPFNIDQTPRTGTTSFGGLPLIVELLRTLVSKAEYRTLARALGYTHWKTARRHLESLVCLIAGGGDCLDDLERLRADEALHKLLGFTISSPTQAKEFLYAFHQAPCGRRLDQGDDAQLSTQGVARIRPEGPGLQALTGLLGLAVGRAQRHRCARRATLDVDATLTEAHKATALRTYEGFRGYQPQMAWWAELGMWVHDPFRDGNVPAEFELQPFLEAAFKALPSSVTERRLRADSAAYNERALTWADEMRIQFAVSADMSEALARAVAALPTHAWKPYRTLTEHDGPPNELRFWAEVEFDPDWARNRKKTTQPFRYIAVRVHGRQRDLFDDDCKHFAVVTNMDWDGERLLRWHREKQGSVEAGHRVVKRELAGSVLPTSRFGSNAAWWRINAIVHNLLRVLQIAALPQEMSAMRPK